MIKALASAPTENFKYAGIRWQLLPAFQGPALDCFKILKGYKGRCAALRAPCLPCASLTCASLGGSSVLVHYSQVPEVGAVYTNSGANSAPNPISKGSKYSTNLTSHVWVAL